MMKISRLEIKTNLGKKDHRKYQLWKWKHTFLINHFRFYGLIINYRLFSLSICWKFNLKGFEIYDIEFIAIKEGVQPAYWDTWKVKNEKELLSRLENYKSKYYVPFRYSKK